MQIPLFGRCAMRQDWARSRGAHARANRASEPSLRDEGQAEGERINRPIGVTLLAVGAGLIGIYELYRTLIFMGILSFNFGIGNTVEFNQPQWGQVFWSLVLAAIWFWEAKGFWELRAYAYSFGVFIALFTLIWGFTALLFGSSVEAETIPWFLALVILLYLQYPGVQQHFVKTELGSDDARAAGRVRPARGGECRGDGGQSGRKAPAAAPAPAPAAPAAPASAPAATAAAAPAAPAPAPDDQAAAVRLTPTTGTTTRAGPGDGAGSPASAGMRQSLDTRARRPRSINAR